MVAGPYDFHCVRGEELNVNIQILNPDQETADLTTYDSRMQVRRRMTEDTVLVELTSANGRLVHDPENGKIQVYLTSAETTSLADEGIYDLELVNKANGAVVRLIQGNFYVTG